MAATDTAPFPFNPYDFLPQVPALTVESADVSEGGALPTPQLSGLFGAGGEDRSPHLRWSGAPENAKSFVVTCYDPDAPTVSGFWHWAVFNIPASITELPTGAGDPDGAKLPAGARMLVTDGGVRQYLGAAPPAGHGAHRYMFAVHALGVESLDIGDEARPAFLSFNMFGATVARGVLTTYHEQKG